MALTTIAGVVAGLRPPQQFRKAGGGTGNYTDPRWVSTWNQTGLYGAGALSVALNGAALTAPIVGQVPFNNPVSGNTYLGRWDLILQGALGYGYEHFAYLCDRLWHNGGIAVATTTAQAITSPTWPARDANGATTGVGVNVAMEWSAASTNAGAITNTTLQYTGTVNGSGQTATIATVAANPAIHSFTPFALAAGDTGITSVQGITLGTSYVTGTINLVAFRILAATPANTYQSPTTVDALTGGMVRLYNGSVPFIVHYASSNTVQAVGQIVYAQG